jgi:NADP-dependent 3-hydroxy acid dehydrogenase YdfG
MLEALKGLSQSVLLLQSLKDLFMKSFAQKVAVVTGAGSGMGRYLAILLARAGADVVICDVNTETLAETETLLQRYNVAVSSIPLDMADKAAVEALPEQVIARHGKVDLLFNNAGVTVGAEFETMTEADWDWVMNINLNGVVNATRAFLPYLRQQPEAALVNTSSIFGMIAVAKQSVYHTTKFAVRGTNLSVHCVHPGHIGTNIIKNSRFSETDESEVQQKSLLGLNGSQTEMSDLFRDNGMHPSRAAQVILDGVTRRRSRIFIGLDAKLMDLAQRISPTHYDKLMPLFMIPITLLRNKKPMKDLPAL